MKVFINPGMLVKLAVALICLSLVTISEVDRGYAKGKRSKKNTILTSAPPSSPYAVQDRKSRISALAIGAYFGSGLGLGFERIVTSYFHLIGSTHFTQALLRGDIAPEASEDLSSNMTRVSFGVKFLFKKRFYISSSVNSSLINGDYSYEETTEDGQAVDIPFQANMLHGDLVFGNEWLLVHNLHIAIDWVGIGYPAMINVKDKASEEDNAALEFLTQQSIGERVTEEVTEQIRLFYFTVHFGYRF